MIKKYKDILITFFWDSALVFSLLFFLLFVREKMSGYIMSLQNYAPLLVDVQTESVGQLDTIMPTINSLLTKVYLFQYFIIPLTIFLIWCLFQGYVWKVLNKNKILKFSLLSLPLIFLLILLISYSFNVLSFAFYGSDFSPVYACLLLILLIVISYFTFINYTLHNQSIKKNLRFGIKNIKKLILPFGLFSFFTLTFLILFTISFIYLIVWSFSFYLILLIINILILGLVRQYFIRNIKV